MNFLLIGCQKDEERMSREGLKDAPEVECRSALVRLLLGLAKEAQLIGVTYEEKMSVKRQKNSGYVIYSITMPFPPLSFASGMFFLFTPPLIGAVRQLYR